MLLLSITSEYHAPRKADRVNEMTGFILARTMAKFVAKRGGIAVERCVIVVVDAVVFLVGLFSTCLRKLMPEAEFGPSWC